MYSKKCSVRHCMYKKLSKSVEHGGHYNFLNKQLIIIIKYDNATPNSTDFTWKSQDYWPTWLTEGNFFFSLKL